MDDKFDPFSDRLARDLRNSLSSALIDALTSGGGSQVMAQVTVQWDSRNLAPVYRNYLQKTHARYRQVLGEIAAQQMTDTRRQALVLWNAGLFFELHELLETIWHSAHGEERTGLKGLIQAAGAYVHSLRGNVDAARGLAIRARQNLLSGRSRLGFIANLDELLISLQDPAQPPPQLVWSQSLTG